MPPPYRPRPRTTTSAFGGAAVSAAASRNGAAPLEDPKPWRAIRLTATYVAVALTFSSTVIIVKLLSDKREIDALHGRIAVGFLIVQDLGVSLAMIGITAIGGARSADQSLVAHAAMILVKEVGFLAAVALLALRVLPAASTLLVRSPELLVLAGIAWAVVLAATGEFLGLSKEVGAFLAGASLASPPYREAIGSRLVTVRDFLLLFFFIDLGARTDDERFAVQP